MAQRLIAQNQLADAIQLLRRQSQKNPEFGVLHMELAAAIRLTGRISDSTEIYFNLYESGFRQPVVLAALAASLFEEGRMEESVAACRTALNEDPSLFATWSNLLYALCSIDNTDPSMLYQEHRAFGRLFPVPDRRSSTRRPGRIRVGYLCAWFKFHPVGRFVLPLIQNHDRDRFEIFCYYSGSRNDDVTQQFRHAAGHWSEIGGLDDDHAFRLIEADDIDILIELDGHTGGNRLPLVARKPARQVISWMGYPNTTGLPAVDYRIVDAVTDPEPFADAIHNERLIRLEPPFVVLPSPVASPPVSVLPAVRNGYITFGAFGQVHKHSNSAVTAIGRVVLSVPGARLKIRASACFDPTVKEAVIRRFTASGISPERIDCDAAQGNDAYLESHHQVDIMLDLFPYNGFTTTFESLWMGVPMVTCQGQTHRERISSSFLTAAGYTELIATTLEQYVEIAHDLALNLERLSAMRASLRNNLLASPLMDQPRFVRNFENALLDIFSHSPNAS